MTAHKSLSAFTHRRFSLSGPDAVEGRSRLAGLVVGCGLGLFLSLAGRAAETTSSTNAPGVVVDYRPARTGQYLGSPSLALLPDGHYVASHDFFGPGTSLDRTAVFSSPDRGRTWTKLAEMQGQWWSSLFLHEGALYLLGTSRQNGSVVIRRSRDAGRTWSTPTNNHSGLLLADGSYHCAPVPVVRHQGRLWRAMEEAVGSRRQFRAFMMSAADGSDLLVATNWVVSQRLEGKAEWLNGNFGGWLEGNAVATPAGDIVNILRVDFRVGPEKAAVIQISPDGRSARFEPATGFIEFPGGCKKFTIRKDPQGPLYWSLSNYVPEQYRNGNPERTRNTLALLASPDLKQWSVRAILLQHPDSTRHGYQYADWQFEGNDLVFLSRTAHDDATGGAHNQHDSNYITFHRITDFRNQRF